MRALVAGVFALAVGATILAGDGLVLVAHAHPPGTTADHPHGLALYRFPIALLGETASSLPAPGPREPSFRVTAPMTDTFASASLLILATALVTIVAAVMRTRTTAPVRPVRDAQWSVPALTGPPRPLLIV